MEHHNKLLKVSMFNAIIAVTIAAVMAVFPSDCKIFCTSLPSYY